MRSMASLTPDPLSIAAVIFRCLDLLAMERGRG
jgi:hypothetical protein